MTSGRDASAAIGSTGSSSAGRGVNDFASVALTRVGPNDVVPPPPPELVEWGNNTLLATLLGMCYGSSLAFRAREVASADVSQQVCVVWPRLTLSF